MLVHKTYITKKNVTELNSIFSNLQNFANHHPLIISISAPNESGSYKVKEKPFKYLPFIIGYSVKPLLSENKITYMIKGIPFLKPTLFYSFNEYPDKIELLFTIKIKGFIGVKHYLAQKMTKAMDKLIDTINSNN
ncbi:MAG: hypothetical protein ABF294_10335 [Flavobacteriales bacterium]|jgi:hypothetical protein